MALQKSSETYKKVEFMNKRKPNSKATGSDDSLVYRWIQAHVPTAQIEEITALASTVLEDRDKAVLWLSQPNAATDDRPPIKLIGENNGYERVKNLLLRIEYGVLA